MKATDVIAHRHFNIAEYRSAHKTLVPSHWKSYILWNLSRPYVQVNVGLWS